jgi:DNA-binding cell septation regulator SpoVG
MLKIENVKMINKGFLKASCDVTIEGWFLTIRNVNIFDKNGNRWVSMPSKEYEADGKKKYFPLVIFTTNVMLENFKGKVLAKFDDFVKFSSTYDVGNNTVMEDNSYNPKLAGNVANQQMSKIQPKAEMQHELPF